MLFNSIQFFIFLPIVFILYWFVAKHSLRNQNILLLVASYFFYANWDYRFLFLLLFSTLLDYFTGIRMFEANSPGKKKGWFWLSIGINLGFLGVFKYYNFFITSFAGLLTNFGLQVNITTLNVVLPVGISFYTFHGLSYVIDIYYNRIKPERNFNDYALFVSFFPLLVAGPIERATHLLPQIKAPRSFSYQKGVDAARQILWGVFKKVVIADNCAEYVNKIFGDAGSYSGSTLAIGALLFAFQIYCDFSGYSDIALGTARLFGIELIRNFAFPYFSRDVAEFWRRWHISLSTWFRDYLYIPLGGSRGGALRKIRNTFIIFLVSGFWHGANWTFIIWGLLNALFIMPSVLFKTNRNNLNIVAEGKWFPSLRELFHMIVTFILIVFAWIFFRAKNVSHAFSYISGIFSKSFFSVPQIMPGYLFAGIALLMMVEWIGREQPFAIARLGIKWPAPVRWAVYLILLQCIISLSGKDQQFIYFEF